jgi:hypothetical protein
MQRAWVQLSAAAAAAVLASLLGSPLKAADGVVPVTEELDKRAKPADDAESQSKGLSDSAVRVLLTYAFSILPDSVPGPDGKPVKVDKSNANKFIIPTDDARRVIRAATRSAYAEACDLLDLERANYQALMRGEEAKKIWSREQLLMINALHMFSVSYFGGHITITAKEQDASTTGAGTTESKSSPQAADQTPNATTVLAPKKPNCPPEQKEKVVNAINAYVAAAQSAMPPVPPAAPVKGN